MEEIGREDEKNVENVEIDALDLLNGKMNNIAIERLRRQINPN